VSFDDWMLALHVLSAFALVAGIIFFWVLIVEVRRTDTPDRTLRLGPLSRVAEAAVGIGMGGTIILGIWLAFSVGGHDIWDWWIIAALVLWAVAAEFGRRTSAAYVAGVKKAQELQAAGQTGPSAELLAINRTSTGLLMQTLVSIVVLLIILDMIWKPGA
jgi:thiosulfate reductase cytochrome b subunit